MGKIDAKWLADQFKADKTDATTTARISALIRAWNKLEVEDDQIDTVLGKFDKLARGHMIADPEPEAKWQDGSTRTPGVGDTVRVPLNKFQGARGQSLNGRVGRVVAVRYGDVVVNTTDDGEYYEGIRFRPHELEIKIK